MINRYLALAILIRNHFHYEVYSHKGMETDSVSTMDKLSLDIFWKIMGSARLSERSTWKFKWTLLMKSKLSSHQASSVDLFWWPNQVSLINCWEAKTLKKEKAKEKMAGCSDNGDDVFDDESDRISMKGITKMVCLHHG